MAKDVVKKFSTEDVVQRFGEDGFPIADFSGVALRNVETFEDAFELASIAFGGVADATTEIGDGFELLEDKNDLVGVPLIILTFSLHDGDYQRDGTQTKFVSMRVMTKSNRKYIVNDGGTGIAEQLVDYAKRTGKAGGLGVPHGFRVSSYNHPVHGPGKTFYLDLTKEEQPF